MEGSGAGPAETADARADGQCKPSLAGAGPAMGSFS